MRQVRWRLNRWDHPAWKALTKHYNVDAAFQLRSSVLSPMILRPSILQFVVKENSSRYHKNVIATAEFCSSWAAKEFVDALLVIIRATNLEGEQAITLVVNTMNAVPSVGLRPNTNGTYLNRTYYR